MKNILTKGNKLLALMAAASFSLTLLASSPAMAEPLEAPLVNDSDAEYAGSLKIPALIEGDLPFSKEEVNLKKSERPWSFLKKPIYHIPLLYLISTFGNAYLDPNTTVPREVPLRGSEKLQTTDVEIKFSQRVLAYGLEGIATPLIAGILSPGSWGDLKNMALGIKAYLTGEAEDKEKAKETMHHAGLGLAKSIKKAFYMNTIDNVIIKNSHNMVPEWLHGKKGGYVTKDVEFKKTAYLTKKLTELPVKWFPFFWYEAIGSLSAYL
jgi:hypothetical protein